MNSPSPTAPLSEKPLGYALAIGGGILGGPIGMIASPAVLFVLTKLMKPKGDNQPNRFLTWALIGVIGAPLSVSPFLGSPRAGSGGGSAPASQAPSAPAEPVAAVVPLGTPTQVKDDRALTVTGSEEFSSIATSNEFMEPVQSKGGKLVAVFTTIKNTGAESGNMFWTQFQLEDSQGRKYDDIEDFAEIMTVNQWAQDRGLASTGDQLFPGGTANTAAVFRVAPDAQGLTLVVNDGPRFAIN